MKNVLYTFFTRQRRRFAIGAAAGLLGFALTAATASADDRECPSHLDATYVMSGDPDSDKSTISRLAAPAKDKGAVCIMAFYDGQGPANSKMLALRRANWVMEQFADKGVSSSIITRVLRAGDKSNSRTVEVVIGP